MFDSPDLTPGCVGPLIGLAVGSIVLVLGMLIEKRLFKGTTKYALSAALALLAGIAVCCEAIGLNLGSSVSYPLLITSPDVAGQWYVSPDTVTYLQRRGYSVAADNELVFNNDGTFRMRNIPKLWSHIDPTPGDDVTGSGTWRLSHFQTWMVTLRFATINDRPSNEALAFDFIGSWPPYTLRSWVNDLGVELYKK